MLLRSHQPCKECGSSDALAEYDDHTYCFSCNHHINKKRDFVEDKHTYEYVEWRGISKDTFAFYDVQTKVGPDGEPICLGFNYGDGAYKIRSRDKKDFYSVGPMNEKSLFGMSKFPQGSAKAITITEGELDALAAFQILGSKYPVVSVRGASSARKDCTKTFQYLNSFDKIYICFDNDEPGREAARQVAQLFDVNKVFIIELADAKDATEYLEKDITRAFTSAWWSARKYQPKGIISDYQSVENILASERTHSAATYPFSTIQDMSYGVRLGEVVLLTAQEGVGKTEVLRAFEYHLLKTTEDNMAIIHLEEEEKRSVQGLVGYELSVPAHLPDAGVSVQDQILAFQKLTKKDGRLHMYTHFGSNDPDTILDVIRYLAAVCGCKYVTLDHITMIVTGHEGDDERKKLDYISTRLATLTRELGFTLFLVSHVNDDGKTRGSRNISKIADLWIDLQRDTDSGSMFTNVLIKKNRFTGKTGPAGSLKFDPSTFMLQEYKEQEKEKIDDFNPYPQPT